MSAYPRFKAAAAHVAPVFLDRGATVAKACDVIREAARHGAGLVVFPEAYIPAFPVWAALWAPIHNHAHFCKLAEEALVLPGPELARLCDEARRNREEARTLYEILQDSVVPLYYNIGPAGYSPGWMTMAKHSMASILPHFNSTRMFGEYFTKSYQPAAQQWRRYSQSDFAGARAVASWKTKVRAAWKNVALRRVDNPRRRMPFGENLRLEVAVNLNGLTPDDVVVELLFGRPGDGGQPRKAQSYDFKDEGQIAGSSEHLYALELKPDLCGKIEYRIRVYPHHKLLTYRFEMGMMAWL